MQITTSTVSETPWCTWKRHWGDNFTTAALAACLEAGAFSLFLYMFSQDFHRLAAVAAVAVLAFLIFHVGISALHAYLVSRPLPIARIDRA